MITARRPAETRDPPQTDAMARQIRHIAVVTVIAAVAALAAMIALANAASLRGLSVVYLVCIAGAGGGIAGNYRRLQRLFAETPDPAAREGSIRLVTYQVYLSPVVGALFALLLYGVFMSGTLLEGGLAPEFACADAVYVDLDGLAGCAPTSHADVAKALVWSFAAGFMEMLVPNFITTLTRAARQSGE
ncbi:MAG: hypothetical protein ACFCVC_19155 [Acidimicrobiia bacterium]